jgi:3-oxoacyl-[acyl-carrier protein] reductase
MMLKVHNTAPFRILREAAPYMRIKDAAKRGNHSIVNVSSTSGLHGNVGQANYAVAKAGIVGLTKTVCKEWGPFGASSINPMS